MLKIDGFVREKILNAVVHTMGIPAYVRFKNRTRGFRFYHPGFDETRTIFVHVPKAAGSSIGLHLYGDHSTGHFEWPYYQAEDPEKFASYFKFTFVREPISRFISAYNYMIEGGRGQPGQGIGRRIRKYATVNDFVRDGLRDGPFLTLRHFRPQSVFLFDDDDRQMVDFIGRVETMEADCATLSEHIGREVAPARSNVTRTHRDGCEDFSPESLRILSEHYTRDISLLDLPQ